MNKNIQSAGYEISGQMQPKMKKAIGEMTYTFVTVGAFTKKIWLHYMCTQQILLFFLAITFIDQYS